MYIVSNYLNHPKYLLVTVVVCTYPFSPLVFSQTNRIFLVSLLELAISPLLKQWYSETKW